MQGDATKTSKEQNNTTTQSGFGGAGSSTTQATAGSNYTTSLPEKVATGGGHTSGQPTGASKVGGATAKTGPSVSKVKKNDDKDNKKRKEVEEKDAGELEPWWPPFNFDGRNVLRSKICINLRNCQYDLFKTIALKELGWRVVDHRNKVLDAETMKAEELLKEKNKEVAAEKAQKNAANDLRNQLDTSPDRAAADREGADGQPNDNNDTDIEKNERSRNNDLAKSPSDDDLTRREENTSKGMCSVSKLKKLQ